jgi:predicted MFS family arabinose efflux permease
MHEIFAGLLLLIIPLAFAVATPASDARTSGGGTPSELQTQTYRQALAEAFGHGSFLLLVLGFFTCGFQLGFVTLHLPAYLIDRGLSAEVGGWTLGVIGLFNIVGAMLSGWLGGHLPKRYILSFIYFARALVVVFLITLPASPVVTLIYGAATGLLWLSSVPPTTGLVAVMFGTRWLAMLFGVAFFSHQVGGFLGIYLGGLVYERTGSYDAVWWLGVLFGVLSAVINLPIVEKPVQRAAAIA